MNGFIKKHNVPVNKTFSSLTCNELFYGGNWCTRKNEHHSQLSN